MSEYNIDSTCPRRVYGFGPWERKAGLDPITPEDDCCSFCGSLNPATLMARLEAGDVELGPSDKNYKVYVRNRGGAMFKQHYRDCPRDSEPHMPEVCTHWVTREIDQTKFYFQHLSPEQQQRFVEIYNDRRIHFSVVIDFHVLPYFMRRVSAEG